MLRLSVVAIVALWATSVHASSLPTVAVVDLDGLESERELARGCTDALAAELHDTGQFVVVERSRIAAVLHEHALAMAGIIPEESLPKLGELVGAATIAVGRLSRPGTNLRLDLRLLDVATAKVLRSASVEFRTRDDVQVATREIALQLAGAAHPASIDPARLKAAATDLVARLSTMFACFKAPLVSVDDSGRGKLLVPAQGKIFPGLRMSVHGRDDFAGGGEELKGYLIVESVSDGTATGFTSSVTDSVAAGDVAMALPLATEVRGTLVKGVEAVQSALRGTAPFTGTTNAARLTIEVNVDGTAIGARYLVARIVGPTGSVVATVESPTAL